MKMSHEALVLEHGAALIASGRLLSSPEWINGCMEIIQRAGETWTEAVARAIKSLPGSDQNRLRELVKWVRAYETHQPTQAYIPQAPVAPSNLPKSFAGFSANEDD